MAAATHTFFASVADVRTEAEALARAAAARGEKVCGWLGAGAPVELIEAAGLLPIELSAGDSRETPLADEYMEDLFDPVVRGVFERLLRGEFDFLSAIVLPRSGDSVHRFYYYLCELQRMGLAALPQALLFDGSQAPGDPSEQYSSDRIGELRAKLAAIGGGKAGEAEFVLAIARSTQRRELLQDFARRRIAGDLAISGGDALGIHAAARMLPHQVFVDRMTAALASAPKSQLDDAPRIVVAGSPHDDDGLHRAIESAGGKVVGDFHAGGDLSIGAAISSAAWGLKAHYRDGVWTPRSFGDAAARILAFAVEARADAVVFSYFPVEEALTWDYPEQVAVLEAGGAATLRLPDQVRPYDGAAARAPLEALIVKLRARRT
jgi:benzoyl-CoA reductase/2-hydroxyglutaryl-CoA dehydratase subunit BcrC/BadD/HgdB